MAKTKTRYLGEVEIDTEKVISFPTGLPGFSEEEKFIILDLPGNPVFQILQSLMTPELAFIVTNPYHFHQDYTLELDKTIQESLSIKDKKDVIVLSIVTLKEPFHTSTLNLQAPIIIHSKRRIAKQYILNVDTYSSRAGMMLPDDPAVKGDA